MANNLIALARRSGEDVQMQRLRNPLAEAQAAKKNEDVVDEEKRFRRRVIVELEAAAKKREIALTGRNTKTVQTVRIAQALSNADKDVAGALSVEDVGGEALRVGDFNGLLRGARSHQATMRILGMMDKLRVETDTAVYAAILASLHHPNYLVEGADPAEVAANQRARYGDDQVADERSTDALGSAKSDYEAYKEKRIAAAKTWFDKCSPSERSADLYNHYLYMLRSPSHAETFNATLEAFRGNTVRTPAETAAVQKFLEQQKEAAQGMKPPSMSPGTADAEESGFVPIIQPPRWTCQPNSKTYELLILRFRYSHDWPAMWALLEEMQAQQVRGTQRLYNILIAEAKQHPPSVFKGRKVQDSARVIMDLYRQMKADRLDVNSLDNTVNLVNAWTSVRTNRRRS
ncbi:hypothetical protein STCU_03017 [Strigomonas culicis]|uniref:Uncharacterized protein n=1 Tax=Strigomonas culicis TaxID=28005 RepID=S9W7N6_9TRYP|nr:hypothetical protein STCU_03017 [Strigomonas culicis]|eukprot:EPY32020.1 hypothetical protein STCU_03017 [Strigomonas culicis]